MSIPILCPHCSRRLQLPDELIDAAVRCPACGHVHTAELADEIKPPPAQPPSPPRSVEVGILAATATRCATECEQTCSPTRRDRPADVVCPFCNRENVWQSAECRGCQRRIDPASLQHHRDQLQSARGLWGCLSVPLGLVGLYLGAWAFQGSRHDFDDRYASQLAVSCVGVALFSLGLAVAAKAKGESMAWGFVGFGALCCLVPPIWMVGCIFLALPQLLVPDRNAKMIKQLDQALEQHNNPNLIRRTLPMPD